MKIAIIGSFVINAPGENGKIHAPLLFSFNLAKKMSQMSHDVPVFINHHDSTNLNRYNQVLEVK